MNMVLQQNAFPMVIAATALTSWLMDSAYTALSVAKAKA
jgi:hypothetical protein